MTKFFNCNKCNFYSIKPIDLLIHLTNHQLVNLYNCKYQYQCFYCDYSSYNPINVLNHIIDHSKTYTYKCSCNFVCQDPITFLNHKIAHKNVNPYKCFNCEYSCNEIGNLKIHIDSLVCHSKKNVKNHSVGKEKKCLKRCLKLKQKKCSKNISRKFKCEYNGCNYISKREDHVKRHEKTHIKNKCNYIKC